MKRSMPYAMLFILIAVIYFGKAVFTGSLVMAGDALSQAYPLSVLVHDSWANLRLPLWNPYEFGGMPLLGAMQPGALYPFNIVLPLVFGTEAGFGINFILHFAMAGFFTFLLARRLGLSVFPSIWAGLVYAFLGYLPAHTQHVSIILSGAWMPLAFYFFEGIRRKAAKTEAVWAGIVLGLQILAGHPQICLYTWIALFIFAAYFFVIPSISERAGFVGLCGLAFGIAVAVSLPQLISAHELSRLGQRPGADYSFFAQFSFPIHMVPSFIFPFLYGGGYAGRQWGPDIGTPSMEGFVGIFTLVAAFAAFMKAEDRTGHVKFLGLLCLIALILSFGDTIRPLHKMLYHIPLYGLFRAPSRHLLTLTLGLALLSAYAIHESYNADRDRRQFQAFLVKALAISFVLSLSLFTAFKWVFAYWIKGISPSAAMSPGIAYPGVYIPVLIFSGYLVVAGLSLRLPPVRYALIILLAIESFTYARYGTVKPAELRAYQSGLMDFLESGKRGRAAFITLEVPDSLLGMRRGIKAVDGYDPLMPSDYGGLLDMEPYGFSLEWRGLIENNLILSMLNTGYLVADKYYSVINHVKGRLINPADPSEGFAFPMGRGMPDSPDYAPIYRKAFDDGNVMVYENLNALPRAYGAVRLREVDGIAELKLLIYGFQIDPRYEAALSAADLREIGRNAFGPGKAVIVNDEPERVAIEAHFPEGGFLVLSDAYYPGWKAYIDGRETRIYRANGVLRAVAVPPGRHELDFRYRPLWVYAGLGVSAAAIVVLSAYIGVGRGRRRGGIYGREGD